MFKFKQFKIEQDQCAMKVCTDSCILGAFTPVTKGMKVLDIGTGTGLLSLMLAQKGDVRIDAIEIDEAAAKQALKNVQDSSFNSQISVYKTDAKQFVEKEYDLIISNPPFFEGQLSSPDHQKNKAKHNSHLSFADLAEIISEKLSLEGISSILLPPTEMAIFAEKMASQNLFPLQELSVRHHAEKPVFRKVVLFGRQKVPPKRLELCIYETNGRTYTHDFEALLKDYYIIF
ncbi:tRNA1(Val) (adenine(37)-N6)-methyltransferase [Jiulongibacter sediminis]|uniref:tRNA1(Val) (adenine(37)-N6)-methyltransferase n=1 Tax=Jiulongibacter sediminis TaxID=1605367 RepID=A0A0P7BP74_9BACT|nr:methyltransferase [Jiulongibacter sediminis]KPM47073.1 hypothetical protein AFM12_17790 [Jiulongibacter sediminis]TBX22416.1 hypothetical protein TK44_17795 [Jiulongibacter sediminis]